MFILWKAARLVTLMIKENPVKKKIVSARATDNLKIKILETQKLISINPEMPPLLKARNLQSIGEPRADRLQILVGEGAFTKIDDHVHSDLSHEVGGFMIGQPYDWDGKRYVEVVDAIKADSSSSSQVHLTISSNTWMNAQTLLRDKFPGLYIVGWYHTHPRMQLFLSSQDISIHEGFFREPWHVALVLDPTRQGASFFAWEEGHVREAGGFQVQFPENTPRERCWDNRDTFAATTGIDVTLEDFYETGCWHTRWMPNEDFVIKLQGDGISKLKDKMKANEVFIPGIQIGTCEGRINRNTLEKPSYLVDIRSLTPLFTRHQNEASWSNEKVRNIIEDAVNGLLRSQNGWIQCKGFYVLFSAIDNSLIKWFTSLLKQPFTFLLIGTTSLNNFRCVFRGADGDLIERELVEMITLSEFYKNDLSSTLEEVRKKCKELNP